MTKETIDALINLIQNLGFPIVVAGWFMIRADKKLTKIVEAMIKLSARLDKEED